ncbi:MAG: hypothetical protein KDB53_12785 [Planctomycetes bacterium]|nr:hypothetical protein [Planctomycetota bacterium]
MLDLSGSQSRKTMARKRHRRRQSAFIGLAAVIAFIFWLLTDWGVYMSTSEGLRPKFHWPIWFQFVASATVGALASLIVFSAARWVLRRNTRQ